MQISVFRNLRYWCLYVVAGCSIPAQLFAQDVENIRQEKWVRATGNIGAMANLYHAEGIAPRRVPFQWSAYGNATLFLKGVALPFSFQYSEQQRDFRQPFNQFGLSPTYKWLKLHLGWRNLSWSNYTLNNHVFLGAAVELNPKKIRFGAMYGRFLKAVQEDSAQQVYTKVSQYPVAAYNRFGYGFKLGYGTDAGFVDVIYFHAKDEMASVKENPGIQQTTPGENATLGYKTRFRFLKHFTLESDAAMSVLTRDLRADTLELENKYYKLARFILVPHLSTQVYYAGDASLTYQLQRFSTSLKFQRLMPDYRSFGSYYFQTDVQRLTLAPQYYTKKGNLFLNASIGTEHDNLAKKKLAQTRRTIGSATISYRPVSNAGITATYSNYGTTQRPGSKSISDTVILNQVNNSIILSPYYMILGKQFNHAFLYNFLNQTLNDKNKINSQNFSMTVINHSISYSLNNNTNGFKADISVFTVKSKLTAGNGTNNGATMGLGRGYRKNTVNTYLSVTYSMNEFNGSKDGNTLQSRWNTTWKITRKNVLSANLTFTNNNSKTGVLSKTFQEYLATIGFNHIF
ncbi:MAG: hypothetical protein JNL57_03450 [Bacteroidetes bacterium]|nr:hypothetical protein [Bacteroidota bacterium]